MLPVHVNVWGPPSPVHVGPESDASSPEPASAANCSPPLEEAAGPVESKFDALALPSASLGAGAEPLLEHARPPAGPAETTRATTAHGKRKGTYGACIASLLMGREI
jgi:hypothetical protein